MRVRAVPHFELSCDLHASVLTEHSAVRPKTTPRVRAVLGTLGVGAQELVWVTVCHAPREGTR